MVTLFYQLLYYLGLMVLFPILGILWYQGRRVRQTIPVVTEAAGPKSGVAGEGDPLKLLVLGESTVAGYGVETYEQSVTAKLARRLSARLNCQVDWTAFGISGATAEIFCQELKNKQLDPHYDLIVILLGGNDAFKLHSPLRWKRGCRALIRILRKSHPHIPILFSDVPPVRNFPAFTPLLHFVLGPLVRSYRHPLREIARKEKEVYFTDKQITFDVEHGHTIDDYFSDGVHPSELTYGNLADDICDRAVQIFRDYGKSF